MKNTDNKKTMNPSEAEYIKTRDGLNKLVSTLNSLMPNEKYRLKGESIDYFAIAFGHLEDLYRDISDDVNFNKVSALEKKYNDSGLTASEFKDLAEQYRTEFIKDSFSELSALKTPISEEASRNVLQGLRKVVSSLAPDENTRKMYEETNNLLDTKNRLDRVESYKKELSSIPKNELSKSQNNWLLGYEAFESRIAKLKDNTEESKIKFVDSLATLYDFIREEYAKQEAYKIEKWFEKNKIER